MAKTKTKKRRKAAGAGRGMLKACGRPSRLIGPEDVRPGIWVTVSEVTHRLPDACDDGFSPAGELRRLGTMTWTGPSMIAGMPLLVQAVSLPFVLTTDAEGEPWELDLRKHRLARLPKQCGRRAAALWKAKAKK